MAEVFRGVELEDMLNLEGITHDRYQSTLINFNRINLNRVMNYIDAINYGKMYAFFTKPDLNLFIDNRGQINPTIKANCPDLYAKIQKNPIAAAALQSSLSPEGSIGGQGFVNIMSALCNSIDVPEIHLSLKEGPANSKGQSMKYGGDFHETTGGEEFNVGFIDTRDRHIQTMMEIWTMYIEAVSKGKIDPKMSYIADNKLDYAISIFIFTIDESYNIMTQLHIIGVFPKGLNMQLAQYSPLALEADKFLGPFTYPFYFAFLEKPNSHTAMESFNHISGFSDKLKFADGEVSNQFMYRKKGDYYIHNGIIPTGSFLDHDVYPFHFDLYDKYPELAGISFNVNSAGILHYVLVFATRKFYNKIGKRYNEFYKNPLPFEREVKESLQVDRIGKNKSSPTERKKMISAGYGAEDRFYKHDLEEGKGAKVDNLNRFDAEYQYATNENWNNVGYNGFGKWDLGSQRYGGNVGSDNTSKAINFLQNAIKLFR